MQLVSQLTIKYGLTTAGVQTITPSMDINQIKTIIESIVSRTVDGNCISKN